VPSFTMNSSRLVSYGGTIETAGTVTLASGTDVDDNGVGGTTWHATGPVGLTNGSAEVSLPFTASGGIQVPAGTLTLGEGASTAGGRVGGGATLQSDGTLTNTAGELDLPAGGSELALGGSTLVVTGGSLTGDGAVMGNVDNTGGSVGPGEPGTITPGELSVTGSYTQGAGGTLAPSIAGVAVGTGYSQLSIGGTASLAGDVAPATAAAFTPAAGQSFDVVDSTGTTSGSIAAVVQPILAGGIAYAALVSSNGAVLTAGGAIGPASLPAMTANQVYSAHLTVTGGTAPYTWSVVSGALPAGLVLDPSTGAISGTPTSPGDASFIVGVTDSAHPTGSATQAYTVSVGNGGPPTVTAVIPSAGPTAGGTSIEIDGTDLGGATAVEIGTTPATTFHVVSSGLIDATTPSGSVGVVDVRVTTPVGTSAVTAADEFTYVSSSSADPYHSLPPARICDTRSGGTKVGCTGATALGPGGTLTVTAEGNGGVPASGVTAVVVNVTVAGTTAQSHLTVYPANQPEPTASNLNWVAGQTVPNLVQVGLSPAGTFDVTNLNGHADVIVDVEGYFAPPAATGEGLYDALATPARICDTRPGNPSGLSGTALTQCEGLAPTPGTSLPVQVTGLGGVPSTGVGAVVLNVTAIGATASGHLTVYPAGEAAPTASNVNFTAGINVANRVIVPVSATGAIDVYSFAGTPQVAVDVAGWYTDASDASATGTIYTPASSPTRICDTRTGLAYTTQCTGQTLAAQGILPVTATGLLGIPADATAVVLNVTATGTTARSHLTIYPSGQSLPTVSDINWAPGQTVPNLVVATVGTGGEIDLENFAGSTDVIVDVVGWYS